MSLPPVVLIHGMWSTPEALIEVRQAFEAQGYEVHSPRLPYHVPKHQLDPEDKTALSKLGVRDYVKALVDFIHDLDEAPIIVGHSMGGLLSQLVAARVPCNRLILISSAAPAGMLVWRWSIFRTLGHNLFKFPMWRHLTNLLLKNIQYGIANTQPAETHKNIVREATFDSGRVAWQISMWFLYRNAPTKVDYNKIQCPVLIIGGDQDRITPIQIQRQLCKKYAGRVSYTEIPGACHWTIGGSFFPQIKQAIVDWLELEQKQAA